MASRPRCPTDARTAESGWHNRGGNLRSPFLPRASPTRTCKSEVEKQAERVFRNKLDYGEIRFDLETQAPNYRMVNSYEIQVAADDKPLAQYGNPVQLTLFEPVFEQQFDSELEKKFAYYLDEEKALRWWHRVAARQRGAYYLQGWKRGRIYPRFRCDGKRSWRRNTRPNF